MLTGLFGAVSTTGAVIMLGFAALAAVAIWIMRDVTDTTRGDRADDYDWDI